jgi:hypothetical protein
LNVDGTPLSKKGEPHVCKGALAPCGCEIKWRGCADGSFFFLLKKGRKVRQSPDFACFNIQYERGIFSWCSCCSSSSFRILDFSFSQCAWQVSAVFSLFVSFELIKFFCYAFWLGHLSFDWVDSFEVWLLSFDAIKPASYWAIINQMSFTSSISNRWRNHHLKVTDLQLLFRRFTALNRIDKRVSVQLGV